jgi:hypothetical protein
MKRLIRLTVFVLLALVPMAAIAQQEGEEAESYVYGTYFVCDVSSQWRADEIAESVYAPIYDAAVKDGTITGWGWMAHHTGGMWRRLLYHVAPTMEALLDSQEVLAEKVREKNEPASREVGKICNFHDDYIWQRVTGSAADVPRGNAGFSVYMVCDMAQEDRADEIVEKVMAPIYNQHLGEGKLTSWGWMRHIVGGEYRRLATMSAADFKTLLKVRGSIIEQLMDKKEVKEFNAICGSHQDYMWEIQLEKP